MFLFTFPAAMSRKTSISRAVRASSVTCSANSAAISGGNALLSGMHCMDRDQELTVYMTFQDVRPCPGLQRSQHMHVTGMHGGNDDARVRFFPLDPF
jgi:hypothetical protein